MLKCRSVTFIPLLLSPALFIGRAGQLFVWIINPPTVCKNRRAGGRGLCETPVRIARRPVERPDAGTNLTDSTGTAHTCNPLGGRPGG